MPMILHPEVLQLPEDVDYTRQSIEIPGTRKPGQTGVYRHAVWPEVDQNSEFARNTLYELFQAGLTRHPNGPCLGHREIVSTNPLKFAPQYSWQTYTQVDERRRNLGSALEFLWQQGRAGGSDLPTIGIWSQNRPEWQVVDLAAQAYAKVTVSLYDTLGPHAVEYICKHAEVSVVFVTAPHLPSILALASRIKKLRVVVSLDELSEEARRVASAWAKHCALEFFSLLELEALGKTHYREPILPTPDQIYSICYTSGTTGNPKGAILTHGQCARATCAGNRGMTFVEPGSVISYLPLAHIYGRLAELTAFNLGGAIGYFTGDPLRLLEDTQILRPTWFPSIPRVLNRIYQAANAAGDVPGLKGDIFRKAVATKLANLRSTGRKSHALWDRIVFRKIQNVLGGNIQNLTTGSAPISKDVADFLKIAFSCELHEGKYGLTETAAICTKTWPRDPSASGTVGAPQPGVEIKLLDVPAMGYTSEDRPGPRGELLCRGLVIIPSYYKDPTNTAAAIDEERWLHTGDIAEIDSYGRILIIDRIKNIMKLSQGEYVALEKIENVYGGSPVVAQIYVHGDSLRDHLVAIVVPEPQQFAAIASHVMDKHVGEGDTAALNLAARDERVFRAVMRELERQGKRQGLRGFETVKHIHITLDPFTMENDMLTPTMKLKRKEVVKVYKDVLEALYAQPVAPSNTSSTGKL